MRSEAKPSDVIARGDYLLTNVVTYIILILYHRKINSQNKKNLNDKCEAGRAVNVHLPPKGGKCLPPRYPILER